MRCPQCDTILPFLLCEVCGGETPEGSRFCCQCGHPIKREEAENPTSERIPCLDGTCIGTINERGVCSICGKPYP